MSLSYECCVLSGRGGACDVLVSRPGKVRPSAVCLNVIIQA